MIFVDGMDVGDPTDVALRDRRMLSNDGIFVVVATISEQDGTSVADPEIMLRGVPYPDDAAELLGELRETVEKSLAKAAREGIRENDLIQKVLHDDLGELVYRRLRRRPMVPAGRHRGLRRVLGADGRRRTLGHGRGQGHLDHEPSAAVGRFGDRHRSAVGVRHGLHDGQAEAERAAAIALAADEALEDAGPHLGRDARAVVLDDEPCAPVDPRPPTR